MSASYPTLVPRLSAEVSGKQSRMAQALRFMPLTQESSMKLLAPDFTSRSPTVASVYTVASRQRIFISSIPSLPHSAYQINKSFKNKKTHHFPQIIQPFLGLL